MPEDDGDRSRFRLPPIRLPPFFPEDFELVFPAAGRVSGARLGARGVLGLAVLLDVLDAVLALTASGPILLARSFVGFVLAVVVAGPFGLLVVWEPVAVLLGYPGATVLPSVLVAVVLRARYGGPERDRRNRYG